MTQLSDVTVWVCIALVLCGALFIVHRPLAHLIRLFLRSSLGLVVLAVMSQFGSYVGINLGVNLINAVVLGVLGVPGFGLLLLLQSTL